MVRLTTVCAMFALIAMPARAANRASLEELAGCKALTEHVATLIRAGQTVTTTRRSFGAAPEYSAPSGGVGNGTKRDRTPVHSGPEFRSSGFLFRLVGRSVASYAAAKYANNSISFRDEILAFQC
jgi:hypothetical protein